LFIAHTKTFITMQCPPKTKYKIQIVEDHPLTALYHLYKIDRHNKFS
jgi:hypothetical protein